MTSLQKQLAVIAANSTQQLDLKAQKVAHAKSLLFDPKDAANQSFDTIYQICHEGFQELCMLDNRFTPFSRNLFSQQSKVEDRTQMTAKENEELDAVLQSFLGLISAKILLKPAHKAVEWLIRRFRFVSDKQCSMSSIDLSFVRIHEYNTQATVLTFLPYHETQIFVNLLSILPDNIPPTCRFLYPYIKALANPPRHAIVYTLGHTTVFFSAFNQYVLKVARSHQQSTALVAFWASVVAQALNGMIEQARSGRAAVQQRREEDLLLQTLPIINDALTIPNAPELALGCYMICTILATKGNLDDKVLTGMMEAVAGSLSIASWDSGVVTLAVIAHERQNTRLPRDVIKSLMRVKGLSYNLHLLSQQYRIDKLMTGVILDLLERSESSDRIKGIEIGYKLLLDGIFDEPQSSMIIKAFAEATSDLNDDIKVSSSLSSAFQKLFDSSDLARVTRQVLQDLQIDTDILEARLNISIASQKEMILDAPDEASLFEDTSKDDTSLSSDDLISSLPKHLPDKTSFLTAEMPDLFEQLYKIFSRAFVTKRGLDQFKNLDIWRQCGDVALWSFFIRVWCGPFPVLTRSKALELATFEVGENQHGDEQILLPYLLHGLSDESARVRRSALELGLAIERRSTANVKIDRDKFRYNLYSEAAKAVEWLSANEVCKINRAIALKLEECAMDSSQISNIIERVLKKSQNDHGSGKAVDGLHLRSKLRTTFAEFLCSHIGVVHSYSVRTRLLNMLGRVGKTISASRVQHLQPEISRWAALSFDDASSTCSLERLELSAVDSAYLGVISAKDDGALNLLCLIAQGEFGNGRVSLQRTAFNRIKELWPTLSTSDRLSISKRLLDWSLETSPHTKIQRRQTEASDTLRVVDLPSEILTSFLDSIRSPTHIVDQSPATKRRRISRSGRTKQDNVDPEDLGHVLRRSTFILDLVQASSSRKQPCLLRSLFHVLDELQQCKSHADSDLSYLQALAITSITEIVDGAESTLDQEMAQFVRVDLLVDCIRSTANPQVHSSALLLISSLARWVPNRVLHSVMPVFTFMGSTLLRQSDEYSAHVVDTTVSRVVPPLLESLRSKNMDSIGGTTELLSSFVAAYEHVPPHRRLQLFQNLLQTIGTEESLYATIAMLIDRYPNDLGVVAFTEDLMSNFGAMEQLVACCRCVDLVIDALQPNNTFSKLILGSNEKSQDQLTMSLLPILQNFAVALSSPQLKARFTNTRRIDKSTIEAIRAQYHTLLSKSLELEQADKATGDVQAAAREMEAAALDLPPTRYFVESAERLLQDQSDGLRHKVLLSLETRLDTVDQQDAPTHLVILKFLPRVIEVVRQSSTTPLKAIAISCIGVIIEKYGRKDLQSAFMSAEAIAGDQGLGSDSDNVRIISLLNLAGILGVLQQDFIPLLPHVLNKGLDYLELSLSTNEPDVQLHNSVFRMMITVTEQLPFMLSGKYLDRALTLSFRSASIANGNQLSAFRQEFANLLTRKLGAKEMLAALDRTWSNAVQRGPKAVEEFLATLQSAIAANANSQIVKNAPVLFALFLKLFDLRYIRATEAVDEFSDDDVTSLETSIHESALAMTFKMNDNVFRPFFVRLVEWASEGLAKKDEQALTLRSITLFSFCQRLFDSLKAIVTRYSGYVLENAAHILEKSHEGPDNFDHSMLLKCTLGALGKSFEFDESDFWQSPSHFDPICDPLLSLLNRASHDSSDIEFDPMSSDNILIPTIVAFAGASSSIEHRKALNSRLLGHLRSPDAPVRLAAVKTEQALTDRLGEEWLDMLPEMVPYISELQDDDDETVEREALRWIRQIEGVLGEGLDGMLQ